MMDLSALRLTDEEVEGFIWDGNVQGVSDAQLAKALWGIQEWLKENKEWLDVIPNPDYVKGHGINKWLLAHVYLRDQLLAAGIPKEGEGG